MVELGEDALREAIKTIGLFNTKAKNVIALSRGADRRSWRRGPARPRGARGACPGVGRKTANVVLNTALGEETFAVDTHVFRVCNRTGLAPGKDPLAVELKLEKIVPAPFRRDAHHWLILHGRYTCKARMPECWRCAVVDLCRYKPKTPAAEGLNPAPLEARAERRQQLILATARTARRPRQIIVELDPIAFLQVRRGVAVDRDQVHADPPDDRQRELAGEGRSARREAAQIAVGITDVEDRGLGVGSATKVAP